MGPIFPLAIKSNETRKWSDLVHVAAPGGTRVPIKERVSCEMRADTAWQATLTDGSVAIRRVPHVTNHCLRSRLTPPILDSFVLDGDTCARNNGALLLAEIEKEKTRYKSIGWEARRRTRWGPAQEIASRRDGAEAAGPAGLLLQERTKTRGAESGGICINACDVVVEFAKMPQIRNHYVREIVWCLLNKELAKVRRV